MEAGPYTRVDGDPLWLPAFCIDAYPTTCHEFDQFPASTGHPMPAKWPGGDAIASVPWSVAQEYAVWASKSLPTALQLRRCVSGDEGALPVTAPSGASMTVEGPSGWSGDVTVQPARPHSAPRFPRRRCWRYWESDPRLPPWQILGAVAVHARSALTTSSSSSRRPTRQPLSDGLTDRRTATNLPS